ncbi:MAG: hypothetical protein Q7S66_00815 [bacterium]|nr:hypothetical protein [bacterium]
MAGQPPTINPDEQRNAMGRVLPFKKLNQNNQSPIRMDEGAVAAQMASGRTKELKGIRKLTKDELKDLTGKGDDLTPPKASWLFKFIFAGLYSRMVGAMGGATNKKAEKKAKILQKAVTKLENIKTILQLTKAWASVTDAFRKVVTWGYELSWTVIVPILLIIFSIVIIPLLSMYFYFFSNPLSMSLAGQIQQTIKKINKLLEPLKNKLTKAKREVVLRRRIVQIDQQLAGNRFQTMTPPGPGPNSMKKAA